MYPYMPECPRCVTKVTVTSTDITGVTSNSSLPECTCGKSIQATTHISAVNQEEVKPKHTPKFKGVDMLIGDKKEKKKIAREWRKMHKR